MTEIRRLGIIGRGEPALRAIIAVQEMNQAGTQPPIATVVLYEEADAGAWYTRIADEAVALDGAGFDDERVVVDALCDAKVDTVWVGWETVADPHTLIRLCERRGLAVAGSRGADVPPSRHERALDPLGVPESGPTDPPVGRHVEIQVITDVDGQPRAVGVRDRSLAYRRHAPLIVESSCTVLDSPLERRLRDAAVDLVRDRGYRGQAVVEFVVDPASGAIGLHQASPVLPGGHTVTEQVTGLDLVKVQLLGDRAGRPADDPPVSRGYAVAARLAADDTEDADAAFAPAPGRLAMLDLPTGAGVRVCTGVREGDWIAAAGDRTVATIVAYGADRAEALAKLRRALHETTVVIEGGTTNRCFLLDLLNRAEVREGRFDNGWLEGIVRSGAHLPEPNPLAVLVAAVEAYERDHAADRVAFHARAARGGAVVSTAVGQASQLRYRGVRYDLRVFRTGPHAYRLDSGDQLVDVAVEPVDAYRRRVSVAGHGHRVVVSGDDTNLRVDIDGVAHVVSRDDGAVVPSPTPAFVVAITASPGDVVSEGDPLIVVETMKMETTVTAPFPGEVTSIEVSQNTQVEAGTPLLRIRAARPNGRHDAAPVTFTDFGAESPTETPPCERVYAMLRSYLLGYDQDPATVRELMAAQRRLSQDDAAPLALLRCEDGLLDLFADLVSLARPRAAAGDAADVAAAGSEGSSQEYLLTYLQWLDAERAGLPEHFRTRLERALRRYGVDGLARTTALEEATFWLLRSVRRTGELVPAVTGILDRRLRCRATLAAIADPTLRSRLDRLAAAAQGRHQVVADLARDVRYHYLDEPLLAAVVTEEQSRVEEHLAALRADPDGPDRREHIDSLVDSPQPMRATLLHHWRLADPSTAATRPVHRALLEVHTRRFYRIRGLRNLGFVEPDGLLLCAADFDVQPTSTTVRPARGAHVLTGYADLADLPTLSRAVARHLSTVDDNSAVVVDLTLMRHGRPADTDAVTAEAEKLLAVCDFGRRLHRLDLTVTDMDGSAPEHNRTHHLTFRPEEIDATQSSNAPGQGFVEEVLCRNLHPMLAERLEMWRLANFRLTRLRSPEDVYLLHGVAHENAADQRLFALAEVRDLTPVRDATDTVSYPRLELMAKRALAALREAIAAIPDRDRPVSNQIMLYVRPVWDVPQSAWTTLARSLAPSAVGAGLERVVLRVRLADGQGGPRDAALHVEGLAEGGITVIERPPAREPVQPLAPYRQKVLRARRFGAPYPYEIVRMLAPPRGSVSRFPTGDFTEYDLAEGEPADGYRLVPVDREPGLNTANIVVGVLRTETATIPEGMTRVVLLGDPVRGLGNLAEPECRRIIAALDLAERMGVPTEWFALSSGARIAMDSGTENMDWISAVLRRIIEFTQRGGELNVVVTGINVGAQPYWNAEATMLMHTRGILVMTPDSAMVLTGKQALDFSGGVSAEDNFGIGGFDRIMGPNGQAQYWAPNLEEACGILLRHYEYTYVVPGERYPRRSRTEDPIDRDVRTAPHAAIADTNLSLVGDVFSAEHNPDRKKPFDMRSVMRAVADTDADPLERWAFWRGAETGIVWDTRVGGIPVCLLGIESFPVPRRGFVPAGGPTSWTSGTLFPQSSRKIARAINAASGNRPLVVLANLSGFDGSPESMRRWQLEYGAEIGRAVTNFRGPIVFVVVSRYHGGAFVVFSKTLNEGIEIAAVEGSYASVIGGAPAAATVFAREIKTRTDKDPRVLGAREDLRASDGGTAPALNARLAATVAAVRAEKLGEIADEFDAVHDINRALAVGSVDRIIDAAHLRPYVIDALERGMTRQA